MRLLGLDEILNFEYIWIEYYDSENARKLHNIRVSDISQQHIISGQLHINYPSLPDFSLVYYNVPGYWRCWDEKPDKEIIFSTLWENVNESIQGTYSIYTPIQESVENSRATHEVTMDILNPIDDLKQKLEEVHNKREELERSLFTEKDKYRNDAVFMLTKYSIMLCSVVEDYLLKSLKFYQLLDDIGYYKLLQDLMVIRKLLNGETENKVKPDKNHP